MIALFIIACSGGLSDSDIEETVTKITAKSMASMPEKYRSKIEGLSLTNSSCEYDCADNNNCTFDVVMKTTMPGGLAPVEDSKTTTLKVAER